MHEYAQDAIAYVRLYGCPDLFFTFTCNPAWDDNQQLLLHEQSPVDRHGITARVFRQKLKSLMDLMRYPGALISNTVTGTDGYPLYRRRSADEGGKSATIKMRNSGIKVDNRWVVP
ncbi:helitron_like_N domain-containing protein [Trichonephila clavata]|uniref:Helitron_like_N domain-containing protein n=1 Tax=Trichonephila clavata TaxID=2740835 RepID=A0A8X6G281_TRICU|nr:helitron_like_N domain-containing protein [Trichonephila clavata]